ncbi:MAG: PP2C family protein-serine/threonine phosphatase [Limnohabitans sp.]
MNKSPMLVGRALKSTILIMGELGSIGSDVLKAHKVHDIDIEGWYPAKLRQEIHEAAYKRFGSAALLNFGFSMGEYYSQDVITASLDHYLSLMNDSTKMAEGLEWFIKHLTIDYHKATKASQSCEYISYGFFAKKLGPLRYAFNAVTTLLPHHQSFSEGIIRGYLVRFISHQWEFELTFHSNKTQSDEFHSAFFWECEFKPQLNPKVSASESTAAYRLHIKELLFKKVLDESNAALATLMSSVRYARLIQQAQLPQIPYAQQWLQGFCVEWHPRDTIGGDFWWIYHHPASDSLTIALIDCTGHGVPGAMLSVLVNAQLDKIFSMNPTIDLADAVVQLDQLVRKSLRQEQSGTESDEGCDGAFVRIHLLARQLEYVGAKINLYELNAQGEKIQHKAERISLGYRDTPRLKFAAQTLSITQGSKFLMVTDGVTDQLGGPSEKPVAFGYKRMLHAMEAAANRNVNELALEILRSVRAWQGSQAQRDDLTIIVMEL